MKTVLGLSVTSRGIAWAVVGGRDGRTLDDDVFDVQPADRLAARAVAAACGARTIAAATGRQVTAVGVNWARDCGDPAAFLRDARAAGFADVRTVPADEPAPTDQSRRHAAWAAASAVATGAVPPAHTRRRPAPPRRFTAMRAVAAVAAAVFVAILTVGSQFTEPASALAASPADTAGRGAAQVVTVAHAPTAYSVVTPRQPARSRVTQAAVAVSPVVPASVPAAVPVPVSEPATGQPHLAHVPSLPGPAPLAGESPYLP